MKQDWIPDHQQPQAFRADCVVCLRRSNSAKCPKLSQHWSIHRRTPSRAIVQMIQQLGDFFRRTFGKDSRSMAVSMSKVSPAALFFPYWCSVYLSYQTLLWQQSIRSQACLYLIPALFFFSLILLSDRHLSAVTSLLKQAIPGGCSDISAITCVMYMSGEVGSLFFGIYLWVTGGTDCAMAPNRC